MQIIEYFTADNQSYWAEQIRNCDWKAAPFLANLIEDKVRFDNMAGPYGKLFLLTDGQKLVSFATLTAKDCIDDDSLFPWIGFVFTCPEYRGHRYSGMVIDHACKNALDLGYDVVYLATDHVGLYEKYGFEFVDMCIDIYDEESRVYRRILK